MPLRGQLGSGGLVFHVMNRGARRAGIFLGEEDYRAFLRILVEALTHVPARLLAFVVMPNHFHLVLWPVGDQDLSRFMQWLTRTHAQRWHRAHDSVGTGAVYQGRYRALAVQDDRHLLNVCRYVEQNPWRARMVAKPSDWRWGSAWSSAGDDPRPRLDGWPSERPDWWSHWVNEAASGDTEEVRDRVRSGIPYGAEDWVISTADRLGLAGRLRGPGRPSTNCTARHDQPDKASAQGSTATPR